MSDFFGDFYHGKEGLGRVIKFNYHILRQINFYNGL